MQPDQEKRGSVASTDPLPNHSTDTKIISDAEAERNRFSALAKRATKAGYTLQKLGSGFILGKWGWVKHCCNLDGVESALRQMGAIK